LALFNSNRNYRFLRNNGSVCIENGNETVVELHCSSTVAIVRFRIVASLQRRLMRFLLFFLFFFSLADPLLTCNLSILEKVMGSSGSASQKKKIENHRSLYCRLATVQNGTVATVPL
jgi:hypothetical protein